MGRISYSQKRLAEVRMRRWVGRIRAAAARLSGVATKYKMEEMEEKDWGSVGVIVLDEE